ncbi:hypothetical protein DSL72_003207 [Monilinia vaccinii-corymbosi]|uniref:Nascent polypeptide-associated complex subunit alpha-like UBA domain-containing protein n=1 Tax=Monilinia vaccinii-corymbosi TaxID=61207 RepID=A0A8A3P8T1_9HELO|nr:hypothetical protein DSL72_003207 [Monilinia vaccinii-corymbosi]
MSESQPPAVVEGATSGDIDDEIPQKAKSAEDRKAAAALSSLDAPREDDSASLKDVDQEAVRKAMDRLAGTKTTNGTMAKRGDEKKVVKKMVKVEAADVTLLVEHLELTKTKATDLLKAHEGDVVKALKAYVTPVA